MKNILMTNEFRFFIELVVPKLAGLSSYMGISKSIFYLRFLKESFLQQPLTCSMYFIHLFCLLIAVTLCIFQTFPVDWSLRFPFSRKLGMSLP